MLPATTARPAYVNAPNAGAIFMESDTSGIFGRLHLGGGDQRIQGKLDIVDGAAVLSGKVLTEGGDFRLNLHAIEAQGKAPNWVGLLTSNDDPDFKRRVFGWTNKSQTTGREYIRLRTKA